MSKVDKFFSYKIPKEYLDMIDDKFKCLFIKKIFLFDPNGFEPEEFYDFTDENGNELSEEEVEKSKSYCNLPEPDNDLPICWFGELEGTGIWADILKECCEELHKEILWKYYSNLAWYDSDLFDYELELILVKKLFREDKVNDK